MEDDTPCRQINIELAVACNNLGKNVNPVCGLFSIDKDTGQMQFLSHTEVLRAASNPRFSKLLQCNFFPGRSQKLQLNIYSAPWNDEEDSDLSIHEEDRIGSILLSLDKVVPINDLNPKEFSALTVELPMWHDTDDALNERLMKAGSKMKIAFKAAEHQPEGYFVEGPRADSNIHQALAIMLTGAEFLKYPFGSSGAPQRRFVWLEKNEGPMGTIYWCDAHKAANKKKDKKKCIPIHTITGLFEQNQTDAFKKNKGKNLAKDRVSRCFSIVGKHRTLDLEARSKEIVDAFMMGIHRILSGSGFEVKEVGNRDKDELLSQASVKNTFVLRAKLRNLPAMPWSPDESNHTLIIMSEKTNTSNVFKSLEQSEWQKGNSNPNFEKALLLPFTIPPSNHPIKFTVYDHQLNDKHLLGAGVVRLDFFYRYVGQEMMVKLRNAYDPKIDQLLVDAGAYMLLTADTEIPLGGQFGMGNRSNYNSVVDEFRNRGEGGAEGGLLKPSRLRPLFAKSALAFMSAGVAVTVHHTDSKLSGSATLYYRNVDPYGQMVLCNEKSGDLHGMDKHGNPKDPLLTINMDNIRDCIVGIDTEKGYFAADKKKKAKKEHCMSIIYKMPDSADDKDKAKSKEASKKDATENKDAAATGATDAPKDGSTAPADPSSTAPQESPEVEEHLISLDIELKDQGTRDAWATAIQEYLSSVMDSDEDEDLFEGAGGKTGAKRKRRLRKKVAGGKKLTESVAPEEGNKVGESLEKSFKPADITKLGKSLMDDDEDDGSADIDLFGKDPVRKKKAPIEPPVMGDGAPMAPPMAPIMAPDMVVGAGAPPPPPPPGVPGAPPLFSAPVYTGPKLKHFHWEVLAPSEGAEGTLWKLIKDDLDKEGEELLEELFKQADLKALKKKDPAEDESKGIRLLEGKRAHNIEIVLKSFRMPNDAIRDSIYQVDTTILTVERIQALLSMVPNPDEKKVLKNYLKSGKPVDKLGVAEQFALYMLEIPRIDTRLRLLLFQAKFDQIVEDMTMQYARLIKAGEQVRESKPLQRVMETILSVGNKLNRGTRTGGAQAFRLASLDKLNDTKSTDLKQTLLDFIVEYVYKHKRSEEERETMPDPDDKAIEDGNSMAIPSYLDSIAQVKDAAQVDWQALNAEREMLLHGLQELSKEVELMNKEQEAENGTSSDQDRFPVVMSEFLEHAMKKAKKMKKKYLDAQDLIEGLFEYFGESENNFEPTEFFKLFDRFVFNYRQSEFKMFSKRLREKKEKARAANKKANEGEGGAKKSKKGGAGKDGDNPATNIAAMLAQRRASIEGQTGGKGPKEEEEDDDEEWEDEEDEDGEYEDEEYEDEEEEEEEKKQPLKASEEKEAGKTVKVPGGATVAAGAAI